MFVINLSETNQKTFVDLVEQILVKKEQGEDTSELENQIVLMVYELYELTEEKIAVVEEN